MKLLYNHPRFTIYFGDAADEIYPAMYTGSAMADIVQQKLQHIQRELGFSDMVFLKQTHSMQGYRVNTPLSPFTQEGDYLITTTPHLGIGIMAADCLPIVFFDSATGVAAIAHAGWRGSIAGVAQQTIAHMQQEFGIAPSSLHIFLGPSAKQCCYTVNAPFAAALDHYAHKDTVLIARNNAIYFDLPEFNRLQLMQAGIKKEAINISYNLCTICNRRFFSHREQAAQAGRQMTVIGLK